MSALQHFPRRWASTAAGLDLFDRLAALLFAALFVLVALTFTHYGVSNDEDIQHHYGQLIIGYYLSGFTEKALFHFDNLYLYGGLFDIIAALLEQILPFRLYDIRHVLCATAGVGGIAATWAVARLIAGPRAGLLALAVLAVCGVWYGSMFNHTKDIPFASAMMGSTYFLLRASRGLPQPRRRDILLFGLLLGAALGLRATGLLMLGYAGLVLLSRSAEQDEWAERLRFFGASLLRFLPAFALAYIIMIAAWPWASLAPLNPLRAIFAFAHFHYLIHTMAFGETYEMGNAPRWYVPVYIAIKLPLVIFAGAALALVTAACPFRPRDWLRSRRHREIGLLAFMVVFPVLVQVISRGPAFTGMRHFLFVVPPLAALAGIGFDAALGFLQSWRRGLATGAMAGLIAILTWNAVTLVRLHPYEYMFYNSLVGGLENASRRFEMDYWVNSMPEAVAALKAFLDREGPASRPYSVAMCAEQTSFENEADGDPRLEWTDEWDESDFFISPTQMNCDRVFGGKVIATIERFGALIAVVKDTRELNKRGP